MNKKLNILRVTLVFTLLSMMLFSIQQAQAGAIPQPQNSIRAATTRYGGWLDQIDMSVVPAPSAVTALINSDINIFAGTLSSQYLPAVQAAGLQYAESMGTYYEITINPSGPIFTGNGKLNPFADAKIREAMNWLVDRDYINQNIYDGIGIPKYLPITSNAPDYARYVDVARAIETKYAYNFDKAKQIITTEMYTLGATKNTSGIWIYNGQPVTLIFLIRSDGDGTRKPLGDYVSDQLQLVGFNVDRQYKTSSQASPIWYGSNPADGLWHLYTAGWGSGGMSRDEGSVFQEFYTQHSNQGGALWLAYNPPAQYLADADALAYHTYTSMIERNTLFESALNASLPLSYRVWINNPRSITPWQTGVTVSADPAMGVALNKLWPHTLRFTAAEGGTLKWGNTGLFSDPINPVAGSSWADDAQWQIATGDSSVIANPYTGLPQNQRLDHADLYIQNGLPVVNSSSWVNLNFVASNTVPSDAWLDWDPATNSWKTVGDLYPGGLAAKRKVVITYPTGMYGDITWHDGSPLGAADFIMPWIEKFAVGTPGSDIYDTSLENELSNFKASFKGIKFVSTDPLVIEYYSDDWQLDAEMNVPETWPIYSYGSLPWHMLAVSNVAAAAGDLAYSSDKAATLSIPWMNYLSGPSLTILSYDLNQAKIAELIPYPAVLGSYISPADAAARYTNLQDWYALHGHFWVGSGPYYLDSANFSGKTLTLKANTYYVDLADKWIDYTEPKVGDVNVTGPDHVDAGTSATFNVDVNYQGSPYPSAEIEKVTYTLTENAGNIIETGDATYVSEGHYQVVLSAGTTTNLSDGTSRLEAQVVSKQTSTPFYNSYTFPVVSPAPDAFLKQTPARWAAISSTSASLSWSASVEATSYEYCLDNKNNDTCDASWVTTGTATGFTKVLQPGKIYYWQVRAVNGSGQTQADTGTWWSFRTPSAKKTFVSVGTQDGWLLESGRNTKIGGTFNAAATTFNLGDDAANKQYRGLLSFSTASLPDTAVITKVTLKFQSSAIVGGATFAMFRGLMVDIKKGPFGVFRLEKTDFQAAASKSYGPFNPAPARNWYAVNLTSAGPFINKLATLNGLTQIRLRFSLNNNNNAIANYISFFSGDAPAASQPILIVEYYEP